jgi:hypothetical protein
MRSELHGGHGRSQDFCGVFETQAFLLEEPVRGPLKLGELIDPLLYAPLEAAGVQEIVGASRRGGRFVRHPIVVGRSVREQVPLHATPSSAVRHQSARNGKDPRYHRGTRYE